MFNNGDYVVYGTKGVCRIIGIGPLNLPNIDQNKLYYTLTPVYEKGSRIFAPTDAHKVIMRPLIPKEEAQELIYNLPDTELIWIPDEKRREQQYKEVLLTCDCKEFAKIIKTIYARKSDRLAEGKKVTASDEKYLRIAQTALYQELAIVLELDVNHVEDYIFAQLNKNV